MATPALRRLTHISLSVRDIEASVEYYHHVLGLPMFREIYEGEVFEGREAMLLVGAMALCLQEHRANPGERFDPRRSGLDHLAFSVEGLDDLAEFADELTRRGLEHSGIKELPGFGHFIETRDPDGILVELHCMPGR